jgi:hypothetical protein
MLCKHFLHLSLRLRTDWMIHSWHLFWTDEIHEFVKFFEERNDQVVFPHDLWRSYAVNRYTSLFFQLYLRSFLFLCLTIAILLLYKRHAQRNALLATACNWKHVLRMTNPFSRKVSIRTSLEDRPHHHGWRKAFLFHFPQNLQDWVMKIQSLPRSDIKRKQKTYRHHFAHHKHLCI